MDKYTLIILLRILVIILILIVIGIIAYGMWRNRKSEAAHKSDTAANDPLESILAEEDDLSRQTAQLNPSFFGDTPPKAEAPLAKKPKLKPKPTPSAPAARTGAKPPSTVLPYTIMARFGRTLSGKDVATLARTFGLKRSPKGAYELIAEDGEAVMFTMINVRKPGVFPQDLSTLEKLEGVMLIMQLPVGDDAVKSWETFTAIAHEMSETVDGRLCDHARRPIGDADLIRYRQAAEEFEAQYQAWRSRQH